MTLARRGGEWSGSDFADLAVYMRTEVEARHPIHAVLQSTCRCRHALFRVETDPEEACARRTCAACGLDAFLADSEERWTDAEPVRSRCACGNDRFEVGVGFSFRPDNEVRWVTVGERCAACGRLRCAADWEVDQPDSEALLERT
jgi:ribosomal protein S27AE